MPLRLSAPRIAALFAALLLAATLACDLRLEHQRRQHQALAALASELPQSAQRMTALAETYLAGSARTADFYAELMDQLSVFDRIAGAYIRLSFPAELTGLDAPIEPELPAPLLVAIDRLELVWLDYRQGLIEALGPDFNAPRLPQAAEYLRANQAALAEGSTAFSHLAGVQLGQGNDHARRLQYRITFGGLSLASVLGLWGWLRRGNRHKKTASSGG